MTTTTKEVLEPCPLNHHVSAGLRVNKTDPRIHCLDCGLSIAATDWFTLYERWNSRPSAPVVGSVAAGQSNIVFIDRETAASRAETAWTLTTHLGRPDESAMYQYACEVAARLIREMKPVPATVCRDERETFKEAIKWAKKVQAVKLDAARNAASDDEFAAMRLLSEANGAERVVETLEAALEASVSAPIVAPVVDDSLVRLIVNAASMCVERVEGGCGFNVKRADELVAEVLRTAPVSTVAPQQSDELAEVTRERDALRAENKRVYTPLIVEGLKLLEDAGFGKETPNSLSCMIQKALAQLERYRQENGELRAQLSGTKNL